MHTVVKQLETHLRKRPSVGEGVYIAKGAVVIGDVTLGAFSSVWYNAVLRGDINRIVVGEYSNIQDNAVIHLADDYPCLIGRFVTIGHSAIVHACTVEDECLIGMGATILDGAVIGAQSIVGANALVTQGTVVPPGSMVLGSPAKVVRSLAPADRDLLRRFYLKHGYRKSPARAWSHPAEGDCDPNQPRRRAAFIKPTELGRRRFALGSDPKWYQLHPRQHRHRNPGLCSGNAISRSQHDRPRTKSHSPCCGELTVNSAIF